MRYNTAKRDPIKNSFIMPNEIFRLGLSEGAIAVYAYLLYCEDRKTFQCHPSFSTIGDAVGMSNNTVKKYVRGLELKGLITTEHTQIKTRDGRVHNGSLLYTLKPIEPIEEAYFQKMLQMQRAKLEAQMRIDKYEKTRKDQK